MQAYGDQISQPGSAAQVPQMQPPAPPLYNNGNFQQQMGYSATMNVPPQTQIVTATPPVNGSVHLQMASSALQHPQTASNMMQPTGMPTGSYLPPGSSWTMSNSNLVQQQGFASPAASQVSQYAPFGSTAQPNKDDVSNLAPPSGQSTAQTASAGGPLAVVPQPSKVKFETKSTVWADTLSRGLVNLNISGREFLFYSLLMANLLIKFLFVKIDTVFVH